MESESNAVYRFAWPGGAPHGAGRICLPVLIIAAALASSPARADDEGADGASLIGLPGSSFFGSTILQLPMRPVGHFAAAGHVGHGPTGGPFLGVDSGVALAVASGSEPWREAWTFGLRGGYELPDGLAIAVRYDDLGV